MIYNENIEINIADDVSKTKKTGRPAVLKCWTVKNMQCYPNLKRIAVIVVPGGAYQSVADREDVPVATKLLGEGMQTFVLEYSVSPNRFPIQLMELATAISIVRKRASEWNIDANKIVIMGFSAGGHLCGQMGAFWNKEFLYAPLKLKPKDIKPNGVILSYPVITGGDGGHRLSFDSLTGGDPEKIKLFPVEEHVTKDYPKTFIWHCDDDVDVKPSNAIAMYSALRNAGVQSELHIYPVGTHGLSLGTEQTSINGGRWLVPYAQNWIDHALRFIREILFK